MIVSVCVCVHWCHVYVRVCVCACVCLSVHVSPYVYTQVSSSVLEHVREWHIQQTFKFDDLILKQIDKHLVWQIRYTSTMLP